MFRALLATVLAALTLSVSAETLTFTAIPDQDESQLRTRFEQVGQYLSAELGVEVQYLPVKSYAAAVTAFRNNQVQLAWFGGLSGVQARRLVPGSQAIAQGVEDPEFKTYLIAHHSTGLAPMAELSRDALAGMTFTYGSKGSTSGRLMPQYYLTQSLGEPEQVFSRVGFSGDHSRTISQVEAGAYQLGAVNYKVWEQAVADGKVDTDKVQKVWQTPGYPDYHWTVRGDLDQRFGDGFAKRLQQALLELDDPAILGAFPRKGFIEASNADYAPVEQVASELGLIR
ncbi:putative selenate ABC transporter substrate-binding protein [Ferrimonas marina]|uniref:Phosphonate transport system substrate-binding protein n=1 Tax=Ferrimonas marina TaxID=299255 RepID=A0A1M5S8T7_9GAMM|nr:putative selenate ABC transporter substrate-binding protein [Ferrimonas marina]SHH34891.1 phosphonate transport system substrate-binding protein [Ferrimonas marina]